jgi:hypothetical protein
MDRPLCFDDLVQLTARKIKRILHLEGDPRVGTEIPRGAQFSSVPAMIPDRPRWGLYLYLDDVGESLVEAHVGTLTAESGPSPTVLRFEELRTPASKALAAALAIAASELLGTEILDLEHAWIDRAQISGLELERRLTVPEPQVDAQTAAEKLSKRMNRH